MQVVVLRSYYQNNLGDPGHPYFACCFVREYGRFSPDRNATTAVHVTLGIVEPDASVERRQHNAKDDLLGLSVLDGDVASRPAHDGPRCAGLYAPAPPGEPTTPDDGGSPRETLGFTPLLNADIDPLDGGGGGGGAGTRRVPATAAGWSAATPPPCRSSAG